MPKKLLLFPFGGNARESLMSVSAVNAVRKEWDVIGFVDDDPTVLGRECCGVKVIGSKNAIAKHPDAFILAVPGNPQTYKERKRVIDGLGLDFQRFATIADPTAAVAADAKVGKNTVLMSNVFISCGVTIGDHCIILPNTVVSHDSVVGDYCCVGSNVSISGNVRIGKTAYIGSGSRLRGGVSVGDAAMVGLGSTVINDVAAGDVVAGNPAKPIKGDPR